MLKNINKKIKNFQVNFGPQKNTKQEKLNLKFFKVLYFIFLFILFMTPSSSFCLGLDIDPTWYAKTLNLYHSTLGFNYITYVNFEIQIFIIQNEFNSINHLISNVNNMDDQLDLILEHYKGLVGTLIVKNGSSLTPEQLKLLHYYESFQDALNKFSDPVVLRAIKMEILKNAFQLYHTFK